MADSFVFFLIQVLNGVQYGLLLFLVASGLTLIFGIMGIINLAHGSFYMMGAYLASRSTQLTGNLWLRHPAGGAARRRSSAWRSRRCCSALSTRATISIRCC